MELKGTEGKSRESMEREMKGRRTKGRAGCRVVGCFASVSKYPSCFLSTGDRLDDASRSLAMLASIKMHSIGWRGGIAIN